MAKLLVAAAAALALAATFPAAGVAGKPIHTKVDDTFADNVCGFTGTTHFVGQDSLTISGNTFVDRYENSVTFTSDTGVVVRIHAAGSASGDVNPVPNPDGTYTVSITYKGLPEQIKVPGGGVLTRDAGIVTIVDTLDSDLINVIDETISTHGPHPEADSGFNLFCDVLTPIL